MTRSTLSELLVRQRLMALGRALTPARKGEVNGVHHARVATRRLREALPVSRELGAVLLVHAEAPGPIAAAEQRLRETNADPRRYAT